VAQGCQMVYFHTKNSDLGIFWRTLELNYFMVIWYILWPIGLFCTRLDIFPRYGMFRQEKFGNPGVADKCGFYFNGT
jgi:hypothetical protein